MCQKLKSCPFCGGEAKLYESVVSYFVRCNDCRASVRGTSEKEVIANWNRRANNEEAEA